MPLPKSNEPPTRIQIQQVTPQIDCGRYPVKRTLGDTLEVRATIFRDGHDVLGAAIRYKPPGASRWQEQPLEPLGNDLWSGSFELDGCGRWCYRIEAWVDRVLSFVEKPTLAEIRDHFGIHDELEFERLPLLTNAGFYLIDAAAIRGVADEPQVAALRRKRLLDLVRGRQGAVGSGVRVPRHRHVPRPVP